VLDFSIPTVDQFAEILSTLYSLSANYFRILTRNSVTSPTSLNVTATSKLYSLFAPISHVGLCVTGLTTIKYLGLYSKK